jgi:hypothetical protein
MRTVYLWLFLLMLLFTTGCPLMKQARLSTKTSTLLSEKARREYYLVENQRKRMNRLKLVGNAAKDKDSLSQHKRQLEQISKAYNKVIALKDPVWSTAAAYRQAELHQTLAREVKTSPKPKLLSTTPKDNPIAVYVNSLQSTVKTHETRAADRYKRLLQQAKLSKIKNRWTCLAQKRYYELKEPVKASKLTCP